MIYGGRIKMACIRKSFVELVEDSTETQRERYTQAYILQIIGELAFDLEYISWFRIHGKPYLYGEEATCQHPCMSRSQRPLLNLKAGEAGPSSVPTQEPASMASTSMPTPPPI
ncbi:hypothetical protein Gotur_023409 [Gossypium turneri]